MASNWASVIAIAAGSMILGCGSDSDSTGSGGAGGSKGNGGSTSSNPSTGGGGTDVTGTNVGGSTSNTGGSGGAGGAGGAGGTGGSGGTFVPMCIATPTGDNIFAIHTIAFGTETPGAWEGLGFDLDGLLSTPTTNPDCKPYAASDTTEVQTDGNNGIDNSFGKNVLSSISNLVNISSEVNGNIKSGGFTLMIELQGFTLGAPQPQTIVALLYSGAALGSMPKFDGTDCWPVAPESLTDPTDITMPKVSFTMSQLTDNHWVSGIIDQFSMTVPSQAGPITLTIHKARIEMDIAMDMPTMQLVATNGQIGGTLETAVIQKQLNEAAGSLAKNFCTFFNDVVPPAQDIMLDPTQPADPTTPCNAVSIGLGFTMRTVQFGGIGPAIKPGMDPCN